MAGHAFGVKGSLNAQRSKMVQIRHHRFQATSFQSHAQTGLPALETGVGCLWRIHKAQDLNQIILTISKHCSFYASEFSKGKEAPNPMLIRRLRSAEKVAPRLQPVGFSVGLRYP